MTELLTSRFNHKIEDEESWVCDLVWGGNRLARKRFDLPGFEGNLISIPHGQSNVGGDIYFITVCGSGNLSKFLLLDVSGHGEEAARLSERLQEPLYLLMNENDNTALLNELNQHMLDLNLRNKFVTALAATYNNTLNEWLYSYAGHPYMLIRLNGIWQELPAQGVRSLPIGIKQEGLYYESQTILQPGDWVIMFSDGLLDVKNGNGELLEEKGLIQLLNQIEADEIGPFISLFVEKLKELNGNDSFQDDLTFIVLKRI
ncbi:serine/threonine-protein phosphatase [candidate division KSB1 bacterium]|nr:serine/threonine-protein phosphatase [candidate division KSB1 bacterium]